MPKCNCGTVTTHAPWCISRMNNPCPSCGTYSKTHLPDCLATNSKEARITKLRHRLERANNEVRQLEEDIAAIEAEPEDDYPDDTYLIIEAVSTTTNPRYVGSTGTYRKIDGKWHGQSGTIVPWEHIVRTMERHTTYRVIEMEQESE